MPAPLAAAAGRVAASAVTRTAAAEALENAAARGLLRQLAMQGRAAHPERAGGPGIGRRVFWSIWEIQGWNQLFEKVVPSCQHKITVRAQGSKEAPLDDVVHMALATAFGLIPSSKWASSAISVAASHTRNAVEVNYAYKVMTLPAVVGAGMKRLQRVIARDSSLRQIAGIVNDAATDPLGTGIGAATDPVGTGGGILGPILDISFRIANNPAKFARGVRSDWGAGGGISDTTPAGNGAAPNVTNNPVEQNGPGTADPKKKREMNAAEAINAAIFRAIGADAMYRLGKATILGGVPPAHMELDDRPQPFGRMVDKVILTRKPADNPQPPAALGNDLKTLVAQVLHDPGVRPPLPMTDRGGPTVGIEEFGR